MENNAGYIDPREFKAYGIPAGRLIEATTRLSSDPETSATTQIIKDLLQDSGVVFLDWHSNFLDTVVIAVRAAEEFDVKRCIVPIAAAHYNSSGPIGALSRKMNNIPGVEMHPVYRTEEGREGAVSAGRLLSAEEFRGKHGVTPEEAKNLNTEYDNKLRTSLRESGSATIIAPWGTRNKDMEKLIRTGVFQLLREGVPAVCTMAVGSKKPPFSTAYFSENVLRFDTQIAREEMTHMIRAEFNKLDARINI